ncbi:transmembrane protein 217-like [Scyliorhinus canicula]|uniref:transmembrane protein 217-like n=1 Tax=Scyliorhinus canicula TaxID=7830 RepID=UPI0018F31BC4|nr:transmembrane protein 217-like [Scyliorhinus canicula]XP_038642968.1 transmembrane protein 217-like [Scyliorhinus canicula]XP_038642969.1 transmembrane protein 217-like [Scyliorhinus canicula]
MLNIRNVFSRLKKLFSGDVCGLNAKEGTIVAGLFMLMVSIMQLIFEAGHFRYLTPLDTFGSGDNEDSNLYAFCIGSIIFTCLTIIAVILLFLFIWKEIFWGVAGYITWIFLYEISKICFLSVLMPVNSGLPSSVQALEWFGLTMRLLAHIFWMVFVTAYAIELYKISRNTDDSSKTKRKTPPKLKFAKVKEMGV